MFVRVVCFCVVASEVVSMHSLGEGRVVDMCVLVAREDLCTATESVYCKQLYATMSNGG